VQSGELARQVDEVVLAKNKDLQIHQMGDVFWERLEVIVAEVETENSPSPSTLRPRWEA
jgi:hypothetical protein